MNRIRVLIAAAVVGLLLLAAIAPAMAYIEQRYSQVLLKAPNVVKCNRAATITAKVVTTETGEPVPRQIVNWSLAQTRSSGDGLSAASTLTNDRGKTSLTLK